MTEEKFKGFNIVLARPEIPQNTGNIGRLCVASGSSLHLVRPLGFSLDDSQVKRAGLDYWKHLDLHVHETWDDYLSAAGKAPLYFFTTKGSMPVWDCPFEEGAHLVFGNESSGLPGELYTRHADSLYRIPMPGEFSRSLNLANSVAIVMYEGLRRQLKKEGS